MDEGNITAVVTFPVSVFVSQTIDRMFYEDCHSKFEDVPFTGLFRSSVHGQNKWLLYPPRNLSIYSIMVAKTSQTP
jgi:hypothetical protein